MRGDRQRTICFPPVISQRGLERSNKVYSYDWVSGSRPVCFAGRMAVDALYALSRSLVELFGS